MVAVLVGRPVQLRTIALATQHLEVGAAVHALRPEQCLDQRTTLDVVDEEGWHQAMGTSLGGTPRC
jgi:hypothetical protein